MQKHQYLPQPSPGKHLISLDSYAHESMLTDVKSAHGVTNKIGMYSDPSGDIFVAVQVSDTGYRFMPGPELSTTLYRGQHTIYEHCKPSIFREKNQSYSEFIYWYLKALELYLIIQPHPGVFEVSNYWDIGDLKFEINPIAIAQHYDFKTNMLDLTRSKDVAMFFATHKLTEKGDWVAATGQSAILYSADFAKLIKRGAIPVGIDPFPRPYVQKAFLIELGIQEDFATLPEVTCEEFIVTPEIATQAWEAVGGANSLFPHEPFEQELSRIKDNYVIPTQVVNFAFESGKLPPDMTFEKIETYLNQANYQISDEPFPTFAEYALIDINQAWLNLRKEFMPKMRFRFSSPHRQT